MRMPVMLGAALVALACGIPAAGQSPAPIAVNADVKGRLDALIADGSYNDALTLIEKVERQGALPPDMQLKRGIVLMQLGDTDEARKVFERLRDAYPQQVAPYVNLAAIHARNDDLEAAREALTRATAVAPQQASNHESLGRIHLGLAWRSFKLAAELDPNRQALLRKNQAIEALIRDSASSTVMARAASVASSAPTPSPAPAPAPAVVAASAPVAGASTAAPIAAALAPMASTPRPSAPSATSSPNAPTGTADQKSVPAPSAPSTTTQVTLLGSVPVGARAATAPAPAPSTSSTLLPPEPAPATTPASAAASATQPGLPAPAEAGSVLAVPSLWAGTTASRSRDTPAGAALLGSTQSSEAEALCPAQSKAACAQALAALEAWRSDWRQRSIDAYSAHYAAAYVPPGFKTRGQWLAYKKRVFDEAGFIDVSLKLLTVKKVGEHRFSISAEQRYSSSKYRDQTKKRFVLLMDAGQWRITSEQKDET